MSFEHFSIVLFGVIGKQNLHKIGTYEDFGVNRKNAMGIIVKQCDHDFFQVWRFQYQKLL